MQKQLSPREVARAMGVSESSLKRWVDEGRLAATRTAGGHRRIARSEAIRFIRSESAPLVHPELLGLSELGEVQGEDRTGDVALEPERLSAALRRGRAAEVRGLLTRLYLDGWSVAEICDGPIRLALAPIGELWNHGEDGIFIEHRATDLCGQALHNLRSLIPEPVGGVSAVGGAPAHDPHYLGSLMVSCVLASEGIAATNLGPNTPAAALLRAASVSDARFVWLSIGARQLGDSLRNQMDRLLHGIDEMGTDSRQPPFLLVGGQERAQIDSVEHARLYKGGSLGELVAFVRGALAADG